MGIITKDINRGYLEAMEEIAKVKRGPHVKVGFQGSSGDRSHSKNSKASVTEIATYNEFGTVSRKGNPHIPARPFVRTTIDENLRALLRINGQLLFKMSKGEMTTQRALKILGLKIQALMQKKLTDIKDPPNAPSTIKRKKSSNPLIDTGRLRQSITFVVENAGLGSGTDSEQRSPTRQKRVSKRSMKKKRKIKRRVKLSIARGRKSAIKKARFVNRKTKSKVKHIQKRSGVNYRKAKRKVRSKAKHVAKRTGVNFRKAKRAIKRRRAQRRAKK